MFVYMNMHVRVCVTIIIKATISHVTISFIDTIFNFSTSISSFVFGGLGNQSKLQS